MGGASPKKMIWYHPTLQKSVSEICNQTFIFLGIQKEAIKKTKQQKQQKQISTTNQPINQSKQPKKVQKFWGDRDGNPNVTWQTTKQVVTLLRWRIMELYYREVDELLYELSMSGPINQEKMIENRSN